MGKIMKELKPSADVLFLAAEALSEYFEHRGKNKKAVIEDGNIVIKRKYKKKSKTLINLSGYTTKDKTVLDWIHSRHDATATHNGIECIVLYNGVCISAWVGSKCVQPNCLSYYEGICACERHLGLRE